jgi:hypothetical protein
LVVFAFVGKTIAFYGIGIYISACSFSLEGGDWDEGYITS